MRVLYLGPSGEKVENPALALVEDRIRNAGSAYWHRQSGTGELGYKGPGVNAGAQLVIMVEEPHGVLLRYTPPDGADELVLTNPAGDAETEVTTFPGGDEWLVPASYFVDVAQALPVIEAFIADGRRLDGPWIVLGTE